LGANRNLDRLGTDLTEILRHPPDIQPLQQKQAPTTVAMIR